MAKLSISKTEKTKEAKTMDLYDVLKRLEKAGIVKVEKLPNGDWKLTETYGTETIILAEVLEEKGEKT